MTAYRVAILGCGQVSADHLDGVFTAAGYQTRAGDRIEIAGTRCSVVLDNAWLRPIGAEAEEHRWDESQQRQACFDLSIQHFIDRISDGAPFWTSAEEQLGTPKIIEDAYAAAGDIRRRPRQ